MNVTRLPREDMPTIRQILRVVVTIVLSGLALYILYIVREPVGWLFLALFIAVAASGPVNILSRKLPRSAAIAIVYLGIVLTPVAIGAILLPPAVEQTVKLVDNLPQYAQDLNDEFEKNPTLRDANEKYDITGKLEKQANKLASKLGEAAGALASIGAGLVSSLFALVTILVLSLFMVGRGQAWRNAFIARRPPHEAERLRRVTDNMATAIGSYVGGALAQAMVAGIAAFIMLEILGVGSPLALALIIALLDLIPLVGATLGAVIVGVVTAFHDFPTVTIIWTIFAIAYQQFENYVVQPRIQSRAVQLDPFIVVIAAIFGGTLLGVIGALLAIPFAATIQIAIKEWLDYRREFGTPPNSRSASSAE